MDISPSDLAQALAAVRAEATTYPLGVRIWMAIMASVFFSSIAFVRWKIEARVVLASTLSTIAFLVAAKMLWPAVGRAQAGAMIHLALWSPLLVYLVRTRWRSTANAAAPSGTFERAFGVWALLVIAVLGISLSLDGRDLLRH